MNKKETITVQGTEIRVIMSKEDDYISLTDMANAKAGQARAADVIKNWIRTRTTLEFLGTWEQLYNSDFNVVEFDHFKMQAGLPSFVLSTGEWIAKTGATGIYVKQGKYQCAVNKEGNPAGRTAYGTEPSGDYTDALAGGKQKSQTVKMKTDNFYKLIV